MNSSSHATGDGDEVDMVRRRLIISGRVQGVYYRDSSRREASRLGLRGWVRNNVDGTVEAVAEGDRADVDEFIAWCHHGPSRAVVTDVRRIDEAVVGEDEPAFRVVG